MRANRYLIQLAALAAVATAGAALAVALSRGQPASPAGATTPPPASLADQKLQAEIAQLQAETRKLNGDRGFFLRYGAFLTALLTGLVAVGGLSLAIWKQTSEQTKQRDEDRRQRAAEIRQRRQDRERDREAREREREQRERENQRDREAREREREQRELASLRHFEERFTAVLADLGAASDAVQAGAAVSLLTFLRPEQNAFHRQVRLVGLANLKVEHSAPVRRLLLHVFEQAMRLAPPEPNERDLSGAQLNGAELSRVDLAGAALDGAQLQGAGLENAVLARAHGRDVELSGARVCGTETNLHAIRLPGVKAIRTNFRQADLTAAHVERAELKGARFQRARLQAAHFEGSDLRGAEFQQADLRDAYFTDRDDAQTQLDDAALESIVGAYHRDRAHFSDRHQKRLDELAAVRDRRHGGSEGGSTAAGGAQPE